MRLTISQRNFGTMFDAPIDIMRYSDNEPYIKMNLSAAMFKYAGSADLVSAVLTCERAEEFDACMMLGASLIADGRIGVIDLRIAYFPGARQDRRNVTGDVLFTAKYKADIVNSIGFDSVTVVDPHSDVVPALLDNCHVISVGDVFLIDHNTTDYLTAAPYDAIVAPDAGAAKRAFELAKQLDIPVLQGWKHRDVRDGSLTGFGCQEIDHPLDYYRYLFVDDICDGGRTFIGLAEEIRKKYDELTFDLYVTHGIFSNGTVELNQHFERLITTDSLPKYYSDIEIINLFGKAPQP